jgi:hypothetical protein
MPSMNIVRNLGIQNASREARKMGVDKDIIVKHNFLAIHPNYTDEVPEDDKNEFWLAKIDLIDQEEKMVDVRYWYTSKKNNASYESGNCVYRLYQGGEAMEDRLPTSRIIVQIDKLTKKNAVHINDRRRVVAALAVIAAAKEAAAAEVAAAAGAAEDE